MKNNNVETKLANKIQLRIADDLDRWHPVEDPEDADLVLESAHLTAQGIARKLCLALAVEGARPTPERWQQITQAACQGAVLELAANFPLLKIGENPDFVRAVADCAAGLQGTEAREEAALRAQLQESDIPDQLVKRMVAEVRARQE